VDQISGNGCGPWARLTELRGQTPAVSTDCKVHLDVEEAVPALRAGLLRALTGLL